MRPMTGRPPNQLSDVGARRLRSLERSRTRAAERYLAGLADLVEVEGPAAVARALGISRQALHARLSNDRTGETQGAP